VAGVSLDLLRTFHAVYRAGTLTTAARQLGLSQPTVTSQLRTLEESIDQPLFTRHARGVVPTAAAEDLARRLDGPLDALAGVATELGRSPALGGRTLHLGGPSELMAVKVLPALHDTIAAGVAVRTRVGLADELLADLADGRLDLVVSTVRPRRRGLRYEPLCDEEFVLVASPQVANPLRRAENLARALQDTPLLGYAEDLPIIRRWWRHVLGAPPTGRAVLIAPDLRALQAAAIAGTGVTVLPRYLCADDLGTGRLVEILRPPDPPINTFFLAARLAARHDPHIAHAWTTLLKHAQTW
jgi:DNA-binding transcriptional LysR family regulator